MIENLIDKLEDSLGNEEGKFRVKKLGMLVVSLFLVVLVFIAAGCTGAPPPDKPQPLVGIEPPAEVGSDVGPSAKAQNTEKIAKAEDNILVEEGTPSPAKKAQPDDVLVVDKKKEQAKPKQKQLQAESLEEVGDAITLDEDSMVTMQVLESGRPNPFQPAHEVVELNDEEAEAEAAAKAAKEIALQEAKLKYDLVEPPTGSTPNSEAERVMTTKVSGIIYDDTNPAAVLNIEGSDYLVRSGDVVNGYKVLAINKTIVTVQLGENVYKAGVGELLTTDQINYNTISNLENKFGGGERQ